MPSYYRTPSHITLLEKLEYHIGMMVYTCESVLSGARQMQSSIYRDLGTIILLGDLIKTCSFADADRRETVRFLEEMRKKFGPTLRQYWDWYVAQPMIPYNESLYRSPPAWLDDLIREVRKPNELFLRPTIPPLVLEPSNMVRHGFKFLQPASLNSEEYKELLERVPQRLREKMAILVQIGENAPLFIGRRRLYLVHDNSEQEQKIREWRDWYGSSNIALRGICIKGQRYRLVWNRHPLGEFVQLWDVAWRPMTKPKL